VRNYALIGDVHSHYGRLSQALLYCRDHELTPILLGDLFDSRCFVSESVEVYSLVREAEEVLGAIVLQSNHQNKLIRHLKGNKVVLNHGLERTVEEFENSSVDSEVLKEWLETRPYGIAFRDKNGEEYRCAHAYFSSRIEVPEYEDFHLVEYDSINTKLKNVMIYGPVDSSGRISWWDSPRRHDYRMVAGHYHVVVDRDHCLILDGECGDEGEYVFLALYDVNKRILKKFF
jgi:hypothetical protein